MALADQRKLLGRKPITLLHLTVPRCTLTYGIAPCTAALGVTGDKKCYNSFKTCQDTANYDADDFTFKFCSAASDAPHGYYPALERVSIGGQKLNIGESLGIRGRATAIIKDFKDADVGIDKYVLDRGFKPIEQGSFWPRFKRRWPFYQNQTFKIEIFSGYLEQDGQLVLSNFESRKYILDELSGPDGGDNVRLVCKDKLKLADNKRALVPAPSSGKLSADITVGATSITLEPAGIGAAEYPASGTVSVGDEAMTFTRSGDVLTVVRGVDNTTAQAHDEGAVVQLAAVWEDATVADVAFDLLTIYGNIDASLITKSDWDDVTADWLSGYVINRKLYKPTGVTQRFNELMQQCLFYIQHDEVNDAILFDAIRPVRFDDVVTQLSDEKNFIAGSLTSKDLVDKRLSRVLVYFGIRNPITDEKEPENYERLTISIDPEAESADEYGDSRQKIIFAHWLDRTQLGSTIGLGGRILSRFRDTPRELVVDVDFKDDLELGGIVDADTHFLQDDEGANENVRMQIIERIDVDHGTRVRLRLEEFAFRGRFFFITPNGIADFSAATDAEKSRYGYISDNSPAMSDGTEPYRII